MQTVQILLLAVVVDDFRNTFAILELAIAFIAVIGEFC